MSHDISILILAMLEAAEQYPLLPGLVYRSPFDFVACHGREYLVAGPFIGKPGCQLQCFANAMLHSAMYGLRYVEGFAVTPDDGRLILHAWNIDAEGHVQDSTWHNTASAYFGVEFSVERADDALWNGDACILNDEHRNYPIFQRPWTGEDYTITWPPSDRLNAIRSGDYIRALSVMK